MKLCQSSSISGPSDSSNPTFEKILIILFLIVVIGSILQGLSPNWYFQGVEKMKVLALSKFFSRILGFIIIFFYFFNNSVLSI